MSKQGVRSPSSQQRSDRFIVKNRDYFLGMLKGVPASEIDGSKFAARLVNLIARGEYEEVRSGSRRYGNLRYRYRFTVDPASDTIATDTPNQFQTGQEVYFWTSSENLPPPLLENTPYYVTRISETQFKVSREYENAVSSVNLDITGEGAGVHKVGYGQLNSRIDHDAAKKVVFHLGRSVFVSSKKLSGFQEVANLSGVKPEGLSAMAVFDKEVVLASKTGIYRIILNSSFPYMYRTNPSLPQVLITDVEENVGGGRIYGYWYGYSMARITGEGNRNRISDGAVIELETGTCKIAGQEKDYSEVFFTTEIGVSGDHVIGWMQLPDNVDGITHFPLYRTKNIGETSGGTSATVDGLGNRKDYMVWVDDVPVAKAFVFTTDGNALQVDGDAGVQVGDVGETVKIQMLSGGATIERTISAVNALDNIVSIAGDPITGPSIGAIGGGRVFRATQSGNLVTIDVPVAGAFVAADVGREIFRSDGKRSVIKKYISPIRVEVAKEETWTNLACTMRPLTGNFKRRFNDTVVDDGLGMGKESLSDRIISGSDIYIPRRFFDSLPNSDMIGVDSGFLVCGTRGESKYYVSQIGDKKYHMGCYKKVVQEKEVDTELTQIMTFPSLMIVIGKDKVKTIPLTNSVNRGREAVGENVFQLPEPINAGNVGVVAWQSIARKGSNLIIAITNEPAVRWFDGHKWSDENLAIDSISGLDAVQKTDVARIDLGAGVVGLYSQAGGYKFWFKKWIKDPNAETIEFVQDSGDLSATEYPVQDAESNRGTVLDQLEDNQDAI